MTQAGERLSNDPTSELWGEHRSRYRFAAQFVTDKRVLDIACGAGFGLQILQDALGKPVGADYDLPVLSEVQVRLRGIELVRADGMQLPFKTGTFESVVSFETIEHVADAHALVRELRRVLQSGGFLILSTPNRAFGPPEHHTANQFHVREFTAAELRECLHEYFPEVCLYGQRPSPDYRYVPFLLHGRYYEPAALAWKALARLPYPLKNQLALAISGRPFYPGEVDYRFEAEATDRSHVLVAVAR